MNEDEEDETVDVEDQNLECFCPFEDDCKLEDKYKKLLRTTLHRIIV